MKILKQLLEMTDPLKDLEIEMFFRKELDLSKEEAVEAREWVQGDGYWGDISPDVWAKILDYADLTMDEDDFSYGPEQVQLDAHESIVMTMRRKYKIKL